MKNITRVLLLLLIITSCSSDDGPSTTQMLQKRWYLVSTESINPPNVFIANSCQKNSYFDFGTNNLMVFEFFNGNPCTSDGFQAFEYSLTNDNSQIVLNDGQNIGLWDIDELTKSTLKLTTNLGTIYNLER